MPPKAKRNRHKKVAPRKLDKAKCKRAAHDELRILQEKKREEKRAAREAREERERQRKPAKKLRGRYHIRSLEVQRLIVEFVDKQIRDGFTQLEALKMLDSLFGHTLKTAATTLISYRENLMAHAMVVKGNIIKQSKKWSPEQVEMFKQHIRDMVSKGLLWNISNASLRLNILATKHEVPAPSRFMVHRWMTELKLTKVTPRQSEEPTNLASLKSIVQKRLGWGMKRGQVPPGAVYNLDESAFRLYPDVCRRWCNEGDHPKTRNIRGAWVTTTWAITMSGEALRPQVVWHGKTDRVHEKEQAQTRSGVKVLQSHTKNHWADEHSIGTYIDEVILPHKRREVERYRVECEKNKKVAPDDFPAIILWDHAPKHTGKKVLAALYARFEGEVIFIFVPKNCTAFLQPLDVAFFGPLKQRFKGVFQNAVMTLYEHNKAAVGVSDEHAENPSHHAKKKHPIKERPKEKIKGLFFQSLTSTFDHFMTKDHSHCWASCKLHQHLILSSENINAAEADMNDGVPLFDCAVPYWGIPDNRKDSAFKAVFGKDDTISRNRSGRTSGEVLSASNTPFVPEVTEVRLPPLTAEKGTQAREHRPPRPSHPFECDSVTSDSDDDFDWYAQPAPSDDDYDPDLDSSLESSITDDEAEVAEDGPDADPGAAPVGQQPS